MVEPPPLMLLLYQRCAVPPLPSKQFFGPMILPCVRHSIASLLLNTCVPPWCTLSQHSALLCAMTAERVQILHRAALPLPANLST